MRAPKLRRKATVETVAAPVVSLAQVLMERARWPSDHPNHPSTWTEAVERAVQRKKEL